MIGYDKKYCEPVTINTYHTECIQNTVYSNAWKSDGTVDQLIDGTGIGFLSFSKCW